MKKLVILAVVLGSLIFASIASADGGRRHHHFYPHRIVFCNDGVQGFTWSWWGVPEGAMLGPCAVVVAPSAQVDRSGTCVNGVFTDLTTDQFAYGANASISPANWVQGLGETCDNPAALGYVAAGYNVSDAGTVDTAAPQFNVYPFWVKA